MNCILIDDDPFARLLLEKFITASDFLKHQKSFDNPFDAISYLNDNSAAVDLIFLDIEMPEMNGLEFLQSLISPPATIIISSKAEYAAQAFDLPIYDYVLKPFSIERLKKAVDKVVNQLNKNKTNEDIFFIRSSRVLIRLKYSEILWIEALENYVIIQTKTKKHTILFTMKNVERLMPGHLFTRIHRSYIVNIKNISRIQDNIVIIDINNEQLTIPIAKNYKKHLVNKLNIISG